MNSSSESLPPEGVIFALASLYQGVGFPDAAWIRHVDPAILRHALQRFEERGLDRLSDSAASATSPMATRRRHP